ncbi:MAG TPA: hypothetical protein VH186_23525 [Chloroflexia bacterium]|nr:hypothetical protein [Chloroflexia bacterium]
MAIDPNTQHREESETVVAKAYSPGTPAPQRAFPQAGQPQARPRPANQPPVHDPSRQGDLTQPYGVSSGVDIYRKDLSKKLVEIRPLDGVRFVFNDAVDRNTLRVTRTPTGLANTLSIRYVNDPEGKVLSEEVRASRSSVNWIENRTGQINGYGQYAWESDRSLIIGPPEGGWPQGKFVRFEFDRSLSDDAGNHLIHDRDQVIIASVRAELYCTILEPSLDTIYLPWESDDELFGRREDYSVLVAGTVVQKGATEHVRRILITAISNKGLTVTYEILAGDIERREMRQGLGFSDWRPNREFGGTWAIRLPLQSPDWRGKGCQAVVEGHHTWTISATVVTSYGVRIESVNRKVVNHEIFKPRVIFIRCPQIKENNGLLYYWRYSKKAIINRLRFTRADLGLKQFIVRLDGYFERDTVFSYVNTYVSETATQQVLQWDTVYDSELKREVTEIQLPGFNIHDRLTDILAGGQNRNRTIHTFSISVKTRAGFAIYFMLEYYVDTIPLDLENVESVQLGFAGISAGGIGISTTTDYSSAGFDILTEYNDYRSISNGTASSTTISYEGYSEASYESTTEVESYSESSTTWSETDQTYTGEVESSEVIVSESYSENGTGEIDIEIEYPPYYDLERFAGIGGIYVQWPEAQTEITVRGKLMRRWKARLLEYPALYDERSGLLYYLRGDFDRISEGEYIQVSGAVFGEHHSACGIDVVEVALP